MSTGAEMALTELGIRKLKTPKPGKRRQTRKPDGPWSSPAEGATLHPSRSRRLVQVALLYAPGPIHSSTAIRERRYAASVGVGMGNLGKRQNLSCIGRLARSLSFLCRVLCTLLCRVYAGVYAGSMQGLCRVYAGKGGVSHACINSSRPGTVRAGGVAAYFLLAAVLAGGASKATSVQPINISSQV